jgi:hypothetical protein
MHGNGCGRSLTFCFILTEVVSLYFETHPDRLGRFKTCPYREIPT